MNFSLPVVAALAVGYLVFGSPKKKSQAPSTIPASQARPWHGRHAKASEEAQIIADLDPRMRGPVKGVLADLRREGHLVLLIYGRRNAELTAQLAESGTGLASGSKHPRGLAVDIVALDGWWTGPAAERLWPALGRFGKQRGLVWGGGWRGLKWDPAHLQWKG